MSAPVRIGLLGCGTVGQAFVRAITEGGPTIERASGHRLEAGPILVRDDSRPRVGVNPALLTTNPNDVLEDPDVDMVVELMGGVEPTAGYVRRALESGRPVVTANKQLLSREGDELLELAAEAGTELRFEAAAGGAIPVIKVLRESLLAAEIDRLTGIVNGTTNFVLTRMRRSGLDYGAALALAQDLGYAEADPTEDVGGADAAAKMAILSSIAFHTRVRFDDVPFLGIDGLGAEDVEIADGLGYAVKLLGIAELIDGAVSARVFPALVPHGHRLAAVEGADNAVLLESHSAGEIMLVGPGAGGSETASAVLADVLSILGTQRGSFLHNALADAGRPIAPAGALRSAFYVRLSVRDRPGVLARVASVLADGELSIQTVLQQGQDDAARLVMILHEGREDRMMAAIEQIAGVSDVREPPVVLHVLANGGGR